MSLFSMFTSILNKFRVLPMLALSIAALQGSVDAAKANPAIVEELKAAPHTAEAVARLSVEWRTFENDVTRAHKANLLTMWGALAPLLVAGGLLELDVEGVQHDPAIAAELATSPELSSAIAEIQAEFAQAKAEFEQLKH